MGNKNQFRRFDVFFVSIIDDKTLGGKHHIKHFNEKIRIYCER
jgi:hypothetical protein